MHDGASESGPVQEDLPSSLNIAASVGKKRGASQPPEASEKQPLQQRFESSPIGVWVISAIIVVILGVQVVWSIPDSPIRRGLMDVVRPANALNINIPWAMFSGITNRRIEDFEVRVTMADGSTRTWKRAPHARLEKMVLPDRWEGMTAQAMRQQDGRRDFARWVVKEVTGPTDRPVNVVMMFHFKVLTPPGEPSKGQIGTKVLYEENLTGRP